MTNLNLYSSPIHPAAILWQEISKLAPWITPLEKSIPTGPCRQLLSRRDVRALLATFRQLISLNLENEALLGMIHCFERLENKHRRLLQTHANEYGIMKKSPKSPWISSYHFERISSQEASIENFLSGVGLTLDFLTLFWKFSESAVKEGVLDDSSESSHLRILEI